MRKIWMFAAAAILIVGAVAVAQERGMRGMHAMGETHDMHMRHGGPGMRGEGMDRHLDRMADELDLTAEQKDAAKKLHEGMRGQVDAIHTQQREIHEAIGDLLDGANPDAAALGQKMIEAHALHGRLETLHENMQKEFKALLTADQLKKFDELHSERSGFRGMGGPCMPGEDS